MLPWRHAALGYLVYTVYTRLRYRRPPAGVAVFALGLGTQFPDLVDKPLAWHFSVLPSGRSLGHSLFAFGVVVGLLWHLADSPARRTLTTAFGVGWVSHLVGDGISPVPRGHWLGVGYVFWPVTSFPPEKRNLSILTFLLNSTSRRNSGRASHSPLSCSWCGSQTAPPASRTYSRSGIAERSTERRRRTRSLARRPDSEWY
jgi:hypothetical protein